MNYRALLIVCLATLGLAVAGWGQADGKIAFISHRGGYDDVWIMNADGSDPVNLTQGRYCASPVWSPDGTKIAYIDVDDDEAWPYGGEIWLMDADGSNPQQVTDDSVEKLRLWWSEDGLYYTTASMTASIRDGWEGLDTFRYGAGRQWLLTRGLERGKSPLPPLVFLRTGPNKQASC